MIRHLAQLLSLLLLVSLSLSAQSDVHQQLRAAGELWSQGHFEKAGELARQALDSADLTQVERGRGWTLLGSAMQNQGQFQKAMSAYENALRIFEGKNEDDAHSSQGEGLIDRAGADDRNRDDPARVDHFVLDPRDPGDRGSAAGARESD